MDVVARVRIGNFITLTVDWWIYCVWLRFLMRFIVCLILIKCLWWC